MLVEDDDQVRNLALKALRLSGYEVTAFEDGLTALASLEPNSTYDLMVTDVVMPGLDGGKLAEQMHRRFPDLPVLFMSGYTDDRLSSFGIMREKNCGFLAKPFTPLALQKAVADALRAHRPPVKEAPSVARSAEDDDYPLSGSPETTSNHKPGQEEDLEVGTRLESP
jgi:two-component system cell cycle sensor histidine kinase/response regulator CckA